MEAAALIVGTPIALVTIVGEDEQWFKAKIGIDVEGTAREISFCSVAIADCTEPLIVEDAAKDPRFAENPLVTGPPAIRFYAGVALISDKGNAVGTIAIADTKPRTISASQIEELQRISRKASVLVGLRRRAHAIAGTLALDRTLADENADWLRTHDELTSLPLREVIRDWIEILGDEARGDTLGTAMQGKNASPSSIVAVGLIHFHEINSRLGREAGDQIIKKIAQIIASELPERALLTKISTTGFAALLRDTDPSQASVIAERVRKRLQVPITPPGGSPTEVSASVATATTGPSAEFTPDQLLAAIDEASAAAKALGSEVLVEADRELVASSTRRTTMREALATALNSNELRVHYMPIVRLGDGEVSSHEALARWRNSRFGDVEPEEFIVVAEEYGLVARLDAFVLRQALADFASGKVGGDAISVNLSPAGVTSETASEIFSALRDAHVPHECLTIEVTEREALATNPLLTDTLVELAAGHVQVALDDFGSGVTSLSHLVALPIGLLKLDQSLTRNLVGPVRERGLAIVEAIVTLSKRLGLDVVAEGIESEEQIKILELAGVTTGQGMLLGAPMPAGTT
ncbi:MAG: EAL domain-containing protein [Actinobacteria bacterium]|uniref:Unannotated protein n=1 Tax=freshwater metagenome TaxID=449393 RepID=A0A6J5ZZK9_9ZZZZ|nr:EAL domain-containing protein [Actinomycetota bacterium]